MPKPKDGITTRTKILGVDVLNREYLGLHEICQRVGRGSDDVSQVLSRMVMDGHLHRRRRVTEHGVKWEYAFPKPDPIKALRLPWLRPSGMKLTAKLRADALNFAA